MNKLKVHYIKDNLKEISNNDFYVEPTHMKTIIFILVIVLLITLIRLLIIGI